MFEANGYKFKFYRAYNSEGQKVDTVCEVEGRSLCGLGPVKVLASGYACLNPLDRFNKHLGKVIALDRALDELGLNHWQKKEVFAKFEEVFPQ
jgi:hypothetical protein